MVDERYGACVTVRVAARGCSPAPTTRPTCSTGRSLAFDQMVADLRELVGTIQNPDLRALLGRFFRPIPAWQRWADAPAAERYHPPQ